jgi:hypothetical protein
VSCLRFLAHLCTLLFSELQVRCVSIRVLNVVLLGYVSGSKVFLLVPPTKANLKNGHPLTGRQSNKMSKVGTDRWRHAHAARGMASLCGDP